MTTQIIDLGYKMMFESLIPQFEQQLTARMESARRALIFQIVLSMLIGAAVVYLSFGFYYSVIDSVRNFSSGARKLADGDLTAQFAIDGNDELHAAGKDFNDMAAAFR